MMNTQGRNEARRPAIVGNAVEHPFFPLLHTQVAIDDRPTNEMTNIYEALVNTAGKQVRLKVNKEPVEKGKR